MQEKDISLEKIDSGKYKGLFRLKIKSKYTVSYIITQENVNKLNNDIKESR